ncbi:MAG: DUF3368 domain-containing protein [Leptolyngbya sp. SIO4C1]|nr:DUF3368 domain-containing protein [Leptolyngbya sp. SIO4C1]
MIVVADTSPIHYLWLIDQIELLPTLYGQIMIPAAVQYELQASGAPDQLQLWIQTPPMWLTIETVKTEISPALAKLDFGEQAAITLAQEQQADFLIMDERLGRRAAIQAGLRTIGVIGILDAAASQKLIDIAAVVNRLQNTNFRISRALIKTLLSEHLSD